MDLGLIADTIPIHLMYLDADERIRFANRASCEMWGLPASELIGKTVREVIGEEAQRILHGYTARALAGETVIYESPVQTPDGKIRTFINTYTPDRAPDGRVKGIVVTGTEITAERHKLEEIFNASPAAMAIWRGPDMVFEKVNPQYQAIFPGRKLEGRSLLEALPELADQQFMDLLNKVFESGEPYVGHEVLARHRSTENSPLEDRYYDFTYSRIDGPDGKPTSVYDHAIDVTERVLNRELRERFVATLTHDLRTPLTAAKMCAQLISKRPDDPSYVQKLAVRISENIDRTDQMIRDLLDVGRIRAGEGLPMEVSRCELDELVRDTLEELSTVHGDRFEFKANKSVIGLWNCTAIRRIVENLCNNAIKYGDSDGRVSVAVGSQGAGAWISVHNRGNPISMEDQKGLFDAFSRSKSAEAGGRSGWGLGLALVKGFTEAHGGSVSVESSVEAGTTFRVELPLDARSAAA